MGPVGAMIGSGMVGAFILDVAGMGVACLVGSKLGHSPPIKPAKPSNPKMFKAVKKKGR